MKKILVFIQNGWVFGKIHNELIKVLYPDVYMDIICWTQQYNIESAQHFINKYDYFLSTPHGCHALHRFYQIPLNKMIAILHLDHDIFVPIKQEGMPLDYFQQFAGYGVICPLLQNISLSHGISRIPDILRIGIFQDNYPKNICSIPKNIGNFAAFKRIEQEIDIKRGYLIKQVAENTHLELIKNQDVHCLSVEELYKNISLVMFASLSEGNPYPMLEAFACGIPVLGTSTGIAREYLSLGGGKLLPFNENDYINEATDEINKMKANPDYYYQKCQESYNIGTSIDWKNIKHEWINFFNNLP